MDEARKDPESVIVLVERIKAKDKAEGTGEAESTRHVLAEMVLGLLTGGAILETITLRSWRGLLPFVSSERTRLNIRRSFFRLGNC